MILAVILEEVAQTCCAKSNICQIEGIVNHHQPPAAAEFTCTLCLLCACCPLSIFCYCVKTPYKIVRHVKCEVCCGTGKKILPEYSSVSDMDIIDSPNKLERSHRSKKKIKKLN